MRQRAGLKQPKNQAVRKTTMQHMPTVTHDDTQGTIKIPTIASALWWAKLGAIAKAVTGKDLTARDATRADKMANKNWTLRVVASRIFGDNLVDDYFSPTR
jgi:hypothetical protein